MVTRDDVDQQLSRLQGAGYRMPDIGQDRVASVWIDVLSDVGPGELRRAVDTILRDPVSRYWPKPSDVREVVMRGRTHAPVTGPRRFATLEAEYMAWEQHSEDGSPCPVCSAVIQRIPRERMGRQWHAMDGSRYPRGSTDSATYGIVHDVQRHRARGVPHVGLPMSREDEEMYREYQGPTAKVQRTVRAPRERGLEPAHSGHGEAA